MKIEAQGIDYKREMATIQRNAFMFPVAIPPMDVLLAMKISALLVRHKGRDFYDVMFLLSRTKPNYTFLKQRSGIENEAQLKEKLQEMVQNVNLNEKRRDFEHLLFDTRKSEQILSFEKIINEM